jgi:hypothetical protein
VLFYRAAVDLSRSTLNYVAGLIRRRRKAIGSTWRRLNPGQQALLTLVYLRKGDTFSELGAGFGVSTTTAWRYVEETVKLLSARSPKLRQALRKASKDGLHYLVPAAPSSAPTGSRPTGRTSPASTGYTG